MTTSKLRLSDLMLDEAKSISSVARDLDLTEPNLRISRLPVPAPIAPTARRPLWSEPGRLMSAGGLQSPAEARFPPGRHRTVSW